MDPPARDYCSVDDPPMVVDPLARLLGSEEVLAARDAPTPAG